MPKCIELLPCDWLISNLCYQAIDQVHLIKWPMSVYVCVWLQIHVYVIVLIASVVLICTSLWIKASAK